MSDGGRFAVGVVTGNGTTVILVWLDTKVLVIQAVRGKTRLAADFKREPAAGP